MRLSNMFKDIEMIDFFGDDLDVSEICTRSGEKSNGSVFVCLVGGTSDAHNCAEEAIKNGAIALVVEHKLKFAVTQIVVKDTRSTLARMAAALYGFPAENMTMIAVIGTNGKTTTAHMIRAILDYANIPTGVIGTNGFAYGTVVKEFGMTTPDPVEWQAMLLEAYQNGCRAVVTEVSAHAIRFQKTFGTIMDVAVFTNFSQDHLDFFGDMETYAQTKFSFFSPTYTRSAVVNTDDSLGLEIALSARVPTVTYGLTSPSDVFAIDYVDREDGAHFVVNMEDDLYEVALPIHGEYNMYNAIAAMTVGRHIGLSLNKMADALTKLQQIAGRYQTFDVDGVKVVVDYAHTPDGVTKILDSISEWAVGRVITVFGCGGNRDKKKRPLMAAAAELRSDLLIITSDNPRFEDPSEIIKDVVKGLTNTAKVQTVADRTAAIQQAVVQARAGDVVAVLGKGNEPYMDIGGEKRRYCDLDVVKSLMIGDRL